MPETAATWSRAGGKLHCFKKLDEPFQPGPLKYCGYCTGGTCVRCRDRPVYQYISICGAWYVEKAPVASESGVERCGTCVSEGSADA